MSDKIEKLAVSYDVDGTSVAADLWIPGGSGPHPGVVACHGTAMVKEALEAPAELLCKGGYAVLAIDFRSFGLSGGEPRGAMFPRREVEDVRHGLGFLGRRPEVDPDRLAIWGVSFGGGIVLQAAAFDSRVKCVVAQSPIVDGRRWMRSLRTGSQWEELIAALAEDRSGRELGEPPAVVPFAGSEATCVVPFELPEGFVVEADDPNPVRNPGQMESWDPNLLLESVERIIDFNPSDVIDKIAPKPLLMVANLGPDSIHPLDQIQAAFALAGEPKKLVQLRGDAFALYEGQGLGEAMGEAIRFLDQYL